MKHPNPKEVIAAYRRYGNMKAIAPLFGVSVWTIHTVLKRSGEKIPRTFRQQKSPNRQRLAGGCVAEWIRAHPHERLPADRWGVMEKSGCSLPAVDSYLSRRRTACANMRKDLPKLQDERIVLCSRHKDKELFYFTSGALEEYRTYIHPLIFIVFLTGALRTGETVHVEIPLELLWERIIEGRR